MDDTAVLGIVAVLTSGVFGPWVLHHTQKRRDSRADQRSALDAAIEPLAKARAQVAWIDASGFDSETDPEELDRRLEELVHQTQLLEAHALKLRIRFDDSLADAYAAAGGAVNHEAAILWKRRSGQYRQLADSKAEMAEAEKVYVDAYDAFIERARGWHDDRLLPRKSRGVDGGPPARPGNGSQAAG